MNELTPTRSSLLELREQSRSMREAYSFLDEKRMLLANALVQQVERYDGVRSCFQQSMELAALALQEAIVSRGLESLQCQPPAALDSDSLTVSTRSLLGVCLLEAELTTGVRPNPRLPPVVQRTAHHFRELTGLATQLAALSGNLDRLYAEYQRTERRARALEDVLLPELEETIQQIDEHLEALDLEEAVRIRCRRKA